jgi:hypothetical protein
MTVSEAVAHYLALGGGRRANMTGGVLRPSDFDAQSADHPSEVFWRGHIATLDLGEEVLAELWRQAPQ